MKSMSAKSTRSRRLSDSRIGSSASRTAPPRVDSGTVRYGVADIVPKKHFKQIFTRKLTGLMWHILEKEEEGGEIILVRLEQKKLIPAF